MFGSILVLCSGNICRSPMAKALFDSLAPTLDVESAGLWVEHNKLSGSRAASNAIDVSKQYGLDLKQHSAKQVTQALVDQYELILVMSPSQIERLSQLYPSARRKTLLLGQWLGISNVDDPLNQEKLQFEYCFSQLKRMVESWTLRLVKNPN